MAPHFRLVPSVLLLVACGHGGGSKSQADSLRNELDSVKQAAASAQSAAASAQAAEQRRVADSIQADAIRPRQLILFSDSAIVPPPNQVVNGVLTRGFLAFGFTLDADGSCALTGRLEVVAGGSGKDVQIAVFGHDAFINWRNNRLWRPMYASPSETITTLNVPIRQAGTYYLVLSNLMSVVSAKKIMGTPSITCVGHPTPVSSSQ